MNKVILNIIRLVCLIVVACFFFSYFVISCDGKDYNISGKDAAFGFNKGMGINSDPSPFFAFIPGVAIIVLVIMCIPSKRKEHDSFSKKISVKSFIPVVGSAIGLILLVIGYNSSIGRVSAEIGGQDISSVLHTGIGFKASVAAFIIMFIMPFVDIILLKKADVFKKIISADVTKKCPFCANDIKKEAIVCQYCGRDVPNNIETN